MGQASHSQPEEVAVPLRTIWESNYQGQTGFEMVRLDQQDLFRDSPDKVRVVCMSDTHAQLERYGVQIPRGDIFLHCGDFTQRGSQVDVVAFNKFLGRLPHAHKVVIAGNHETTFDPVSRGQLFPVAPSTVEHMPDLLTNATYLQDSAVDVMGLKIYGAPWTPSYSQGFGFNLARGTTIQKKWDLIPPNVDILMTHGPPLGVLDLTHKGERAGCENLLSTVVGQEDQVAFHVFGHIHEDPGIVTNGSTKFINASTCNRRVNPIHPPIVFDIIPRSRQH